MAFVVTEVSVRSFLFYFGGFLVDIFLFEVKGPF